VQWIGSVPTRDDVLVVGAVRVQSSERAGFVDEGETAIEAFYRAQVSRWMIVTPNVQYIVNPGGDGKRDAVAAGIRCEVVF
jgi:porin